MSPPSAAPADLIFGGAPRAASLLDAVDRLLNVGAVAAGEATISIAGVDLIYIGLNLVLSSVETLQASAGGPAGADQSGPAGTQPGSPAMSPGPSSPTPAAEVAVESTEADAGDHTRGASRAEPRPPLQGRADMTKPAEAGCKVRGGRTTLAGRGDRADAGPATDATLCSPESPPTPAAPFTGLRPGSPPPERRAGPPRVTALAGPHLDVDPDQVEQGLAKLVLTLVEFLRQLLERQAIRRMDGGRLSDEEIERMGAALLQLRAKLWDMAGQFGLRPEDLTLDLGPLGNLL